MMVLNEQSWKITTLKTEELNKHQDSTGFDDFIVCGTEPK